MLHADLLKRITRDVETYGVRGFAKRCGLSPAYISDVMNGNRAIGPRLAKHYGFKPVTERRFATL